MADLTNQPINTSFMGLLTLQTSTAGITATPQDLQDGLGNNTGLQIGTNRLEGANLFNIYRPSGIPQYFGNGFTATAANPGAVQNTLVSFSFYDNGLYSYSAISVNCITLEAGSSVDIAFYNTQYLDTYGYVPYEKLGTEVNINTTSTGIKTATFASPLTFSGSGPGVYFAVVRYNTAASPVVRLAGVGSNVSTYINWLMVSNFGIQYNTAGTLAVSPFRVNGTSAFLAGNNYNVASFPSTFTTTELNTITATAAVGNGFLLHTIR